MAAALFFVIALATQALAYGPSGLGGPSQRVGGSSSSSTVTRSTVTTRTTSSVGGAVGAPVQQLHGAQSGLNSRLQAQIAGLAKARETFAQQVPQWYFISDELKGGFEEAIGVVAGLVEQSTSYIRGAERLLAALASAGPNAQAEWIQNIEKLQNLGELAIIRAEEGVAAIIRNSADISEDQKVYADAKATQLLETKTNMDATLAHLLEQTLQVGVQATGVLTNGLKEWTRVLQQHLGADQVKDALLRLQDITSPVMTDLAQLRPEDIETALTDAHRAIEDVKGLFFSYGVPSDQTRLAINNVQLGTFATLTRARSFH